VRDIVARASHYSGNKSANGDGTDIWSMTVAINYGVDDQKRNFAARQHMAESTIGVTVEDTILTAHPLRIIEKCPGSASQRYALNERLDAAARQSTRTASTLMGSCAAPFWIHRGKTSAAMNHQIHFVGPAQTFSLESSLRSSKHKLVSSREQLKLIGKVGARQVSRGARGLQFVDGATHPLIPKQSLANEGRTCGIRCRVPADRKNSSKKEIRMSGNVTLAGAKTVIEAAGAKAQKIGVPMNIAVVDAGANLVAFVRMDGAWLGSIEIAINKAYTARAFDMTTKELSRISQPGQPAFGIAASTDHHIAIFPGGVPLKADGQIIGAVGVSGGKPDQDNAVAEAGAEAFPAG
jgi:uncharacterized protein GlcG (DUF336 family)